MPAPRPPRSGRTRFIALLAASGVLWLACSAEGERVAAAAEPATPLPQRIVSLNPSLTNILVSIGAGSTLVGVDDYSAQLQPAVAHLPRVGGLYSPSLEGVIGLAPDLVVLVPSAEQRDFRQRLEALGVRVSVFDNIHFDEVIENVERLGALTGRVPAARARIGAIARARGIARTLGAQASSSSVLVVLQRDPVFVVGRGNFIAEMLDELGARNLGAEFTDAYPRVAVEWVVARAPEVLIDLSRDPEPPEQYWSRWPSLPAVAAGRVVRLDPELVSMPGPYLDRALAVLAGGLYGADAAARVRGEPAR